MERRKYRNLLNQPLPVGLISESLSVPAKGYFIVEESDYNSPELNRLKNARHISLFETLFERSDEETTKLLEPLTSPNEESGEGATGHTEGASETSVEEIFSDVTEDSLTSAVEVVESELDNGQDAGNVNDEPSGKKKKKKQRNSGGRKKQAASWEKAPELAEATGGPNNE